MRYADIQRLHEAGLITEAQREQIIGHFGLREHSHRFLAFLVVTGGLLVSLGLILLVASNWDGIPRFAKLAAGVTLLVGAHAGGYWCREGGGHRPRTGEALHVAGALLFLANIALVGQIYHLSSRLPDAWLLWWAGIAGLPWVLRSRPLHALSLIAFLIWLGSESWSRDGWLRFGGGGYPLLLFMVMGLAWYGWGRWLQTTRWRIFAADTERLGLSMALLLSIPLTSHDMVHEMFRRFGEGTTLPFWVLAAIAAVALIAGLRTDTRLDRSWKIVWGSSLGALLVLLAAITVTGGELGEPFSRASAARLLAALGAVLLFTLALVQVRLGVLLASEWLVNLGMVLVAGVVISTYLGLLGSMAETGTFFVVSGILLIGFGAFLERRRRDLLHQVRLGQTAGTA